ncbi:hypothetical protein [Rugamonas aquatica]|uniref:Uncharacterized protein n=1 Tax=Rugamonas aquatica TaxID=2743357 RepID=A0A6A7N0E1_9BURK|nr:hypothetical protein [Rugamonas aquatica]MQA38455.1 hypothetical protein [Rugamonas aquatica]
MDDFKNTIICFNHFPKLKDQTMSKFWIFLSVSLLAGCHTSLSVSRLTPEADSIPSGAIYQLPATQLDITATFRIAQCGVAYKGLPDEDWRFESELVSAKITSSSVGDPQERYVIDYSKLNSPMKITTANLAWYPSGMIKTVNADIDDRTAEVTANLASAVINVAKAVYAPLGIAATGPTGDPLSECPAPLSKNIKDLAGLRDSIIDATKKDAVLKPKLEALAAAKQALEAAQAALKESPTDKKLQANVTSAKEKFDKLDKVYGKAKLTAPALVEQQTALTKRLTSTVNLQWIPRRGEESGQLCQKVTAPLAVFINSYIDDSLTTAEVEALRKAKTKVESSSMWVCLTNVDGADFQAPKKSSSTDAGAAPTIQSATGLIYRWPASARIAAYGITKDGNINKGIRHAVDGDVSILFAQLGPKGQLTLDNGTFDKNTLKVAFVENGAPSTLDFTAQSAAERGSAAVKDLTAQYAVLRDLKAKAEKAKADATDAATKAAKAAEIAQLDYQISLVSKQQALDLARLGGKDKVQQEIDAESKTAELLEKKIETEKQRQALEKLLSERAQ